VPEHSFKEYYHNVCITPNKHAVARLKAVALRSTNFTTITFFSVATYYIDPRVLTEEQNNDTLAQHVSRLAFDRINTFEGTSQVGLWLSVGDIRGGTSEHLPVHYPI
jgi:hypothetical protein